MPSSISSSNDITRVIPKHHWGSLLKISVIIALILTLSWEVFWRSKGYAPSIDDNKDLWAQTRSKISESKTVLIGSSRMLFDFNLEEYKSSFGDLPLQLATVGTNPSFYLHDIANNTNFSGTLIVGIVPMLWYVPEGMPVDLPTKNLKYFSQWSYAQKLGHLLDIPLQKSLAFLNGEDLPLKKLMEHKIPNRPMAQIPPRIPPFFMTIDLNRQGKMSRRMETDEDFQNLVKNIWTPLFTPPPPPPIFTKEQFMKMFQEHMARVRKEVSASVKKLKDRGAKVVFVRFPSSGKVRELENQFGPRVAFYEPLIKEASPDLAIHFEDYSELQGFHLPEWSHLGAKDAHEFTKRLIKIIKEKI